MKEMQGRERAWRAIMKRKRLTWRAMPVDRDRCIMAGCRAVDAWIVDPDNPLAIDAIRRVPAIVDAVLAELQAGKP